jgi:hypothetical protein
LGTKKDFNNYKIIGDKVIIYLLYKSKITFETIVDIVHLKKLIDYNIRWYAGYDPNHDGYYVFHSEYGGEKGSRKKEKSILLHRFIVGAKESEYVNHIDHDGLNNIDSNLEIITNQQNLTDRKSRNSNNKTGYRNVCLIDGWYTVQLQVNGKNTILGRFKDVDEAGIFAEEMRQKHYGRFAGRN